MSTSPVSLVDRLNAWLRNSITIKLLSIGFLLLLLLIPSTMVESLITERAENRDAATREISGKWGGPQLVLGPVLALPYTARSQDEKGRPQRTTEYLCFLPDSLATTGQLEPERRHRGIYEAVVYRARLRVRGVFQTASLADLDLDPADIHWAEAFVALGISDLKGIRNSLRLSWDGQPRGFEPGVPSPQLLPVGTPPGVASDETAVRNERQRYSKFQGTDEVPAEDGSNNSGLSAPVPVPNAAALVGRHTFSFELDLNGSTGLLLAPLGRQTTARLAAPWPDPSFIGAFLPAQRQVTAQQFTADWRVLHLNRNYPQRWRTAAFQPNVNGSTFGVRLLVPVNEYQKTMRAAKYALLPLTLTFLIFFFVEVLNRRRIHPFQYILVGLALVIFYVLLLALSEHMPFNAAYGLAGAAIIGLVTAYAAAVFRQRRLVLITAGVLTLIYGFVFVVIQLQDYALLIGSLGLLLVLGIVMFLSRRIRWYDSAAPETLSE
ncbi:cell envelope integrity protein CreD [Hymenobacter sp. 15J16-1T3B]|uniref:cell envelope integrity protein CreD n=1 Tax=Hymenobacter sp. 15J16-1T3B TaxID=2886941 RepID=UPI001D116CC0|nr:cell envelope integrity protein CreD [Hymenobacter sp. 15J16-1T3B]MCC3157216.1 cell envelope integrity protein CreD [Hymenobacter sp. 15J16-1T3B]